MPTEKLANVKKLVDESMETTIQRIEYDGDKSPAMEKRRMQLMASPPSGEPLGYGQITVPLLLVINDKLDKIIKHLGI